MSSNIIMPNKASKEQQQQQQQKHEFHLRFLSCLSKQRTDEEKEQATQKKTHVNNVNIDVCVRACVCVLFLGKY